MKCFYRLTFKNQKDIIIESGIPDKEEELIEMFKLRFEVYSQKNYIDVKKFPNGLEQDKYDFQNKCKYFIASINGNIIGSLRLIINNPLPTQIYFNFTEPPELSRIPNNKKLETGRLVIKYHQLYKTIKLGRHLILLILLKSAFDYAYENQYSVGYAFIKKKLANKLNIINFPYHKITNYQQKCSQDDILFKYFNDPKDPVIPIFYLSEEVKSYFDKLFNLKLLFTVSKNDSCTFITVNNLNYNFYVKYLYLKNSLSRLFK
jgi:N-acyl-L-homoserine lactone synthetase